MANHNLFIFNSICFPLFKDTLHGDYGTRHYIIICLISCATITEMCSSDKMTSALLAMSLSYYCVMEEQMKKERKAADKILATLLTCNGNSVPPKHTTSVQCNLYTSVYNNKSTV